MGAGHPGAKALRGSASTRGTGAGTGEAAEVSALQSPVPFPAFFPLLASFLSVQRYSNSSYRMAPAESSPARTPNFLGAFLGRHPRPYSPLPPALLNAQQNLE